MSKIDKVIWINIIIMVTFLLYGIIAMFYHSWSNQKDFYFFNLSEALINIGAIHWVLGVLALIIKNIPRKEKIRVGD